MSAEFWALVSGLPSWDLSGAWTRGLTAVDARLDGMQADIAGIKERLAAVELSLLVKGLHIEIQGRETT